jgi:endonuclease YncB( thermonuclease family)
MGVMSEWRWDATVIRWVDGDTVWLTVWREDRIDAGFRSRTFVRHEHDLCFRVYGIDTPEDSKGKPAHARAALLAPEGTAVTAVTFKPLPEDKYGRWLADIVTPAGLSVSAELLTEGFAVPYFGGTKGVLTPNPG